MQVSKASPNLDDLDLNPLFVQADPGNNKRYCEISEINQVPDTLDQEIWPQIEKALDESEKINNEFLIKNTNRAVGTRICLLYTSPSPRDATLSRMPSSA